jgi:hypothetical protein
LPGLEAFFILTRKNSQALFTTLAAEALKLASYEAEYFMPFAKNI